MAEAVEAVEAVEAAVIAVVIERIDRYRSIEGVEPSAVDIIRWALEAAAEAPIAGKGIASWGLDRDDY